MSNTTVVQYTRTHSAAHVSQKRSDVILIMKTIRNQIEDGLRSHMSREVRVGIMRRRQEFLSRIVSGVLSLRTFSRAANHRIGGGGGITSDIGYDHDQGVLALSSVISMAAGV